VVFTAEEEIDSFVLIGSKVDGMLGDDQEDTPMTPLIRIKTT